MENLFDIMKDRSKAQAFDFLMESFNELKDENQILKDRVKYLEELIVEYTGAMVEAINKQLQF